MFLSTVISEASVAGPLPTSTGEAGPGQWLLGDWNGARTHLRDRGVDLQLGYAGELAYNVTGGSRQEAAYADQYFADATFDFERLLGLHDATFQITFTVRTGRSLSDDAQLGTLQEVQEIYGRGQTGRLTELWFDQKYFGGKLDWKIGRMPFGEDFAVFSCEFENLTFCGSGPGNIATTYIFNWPVSQWATRFKYTLADFGYVQIGVYDSNSRYAGMESRMLPVFFPGSTGALIPFEVAWMPNQGGALPGSYKIGGWYDTSAADDAVSDVNGNPITITGLPPRQNQGRYGTYIVITQQLTPLPFPGINSGLLGFFRASAADTQTSTIDLQLAGGLIYTGPFRARPDDDIGLAVGLTHVNSRVASAEALQNSLGLGPVPVHGSELAMELHYTFRPTRGLLLRPSAQYVIHPGGTSDNENAFVLGFTTLIKF